MASQSNMKPAGVCENKKCGEEPKMPEPELEPYKRPPCMEGLVPPCRVQGKSPPRVRKAPTPVPEPEMPERVCFPTPKTCRE
ncbi:hypothetical protein PoB_005145400 [Plakobranchus ocellatus]|uniref:Uncharacterized protein n=1 Tax=Plakobranchus ocellatus TaxID=259542 RepID=A0AAV4BXL7_9GAST|nr:hypothetical protein PoB_005145400 [Plakobranchus ocellatus]